MMTEIFYFPAGPAYLDSPSPNFGIKIIDRNIKSSEKPTPLAKLLESRLSIQIQKAKFTGKFNSGVTTFRVFCYLKQYNDIIN